MEMCYAGGALVMPSNYVVMDEEEMSYVEGGIGVTGVCAIIGAVIAVHGAGYSTGEKIAVKCHSAGLTKKEYQKYKWKIRAYVCSPMCLGTVGAATMLGFEEKLYSYKK